MKKVLCAAVAATVIAIVSLGLQAHAANDLVQFPDNFKDGVHYATVNRGGIREELFTSREVIEAAKKGETLPNGTVITMEDYRDAQLYRYVVMEKRAGWGSEYPETIRNGAWEFREFRPDRSPNLSEDGRRCMTCHKAQASQDFVFTRDRMKSAK